MATSLARVRFGPQAGHQTIDGRGQLGARQMPLAVADHDLIGALAGPFEDGASDRPFGELVRQTA